MTEMKNEFDVFDVPLLDDLQRIAKCIVCDIPLDGEAAIPIVLMDYSGLRAYTFCSENCLLLWIKKRPKVTLRRVEKKE